MPGRALRDETHHANSIYQGPGFARRREVLRETLARLERGGRERYAQLAQVNLTRWAAEARARATERGSQTREERVGQGPRVRVVSDDWGVATAALTRETGACCAVLNMANAHVPGGAYVEGAPAQEENLFRRTDAHYSIVSEELDALSERYPLATTELLEARAGRVYLDTKAPRVCVRGPEDRAREDLGYPWLTDDEVFPFYELRAAAQDLRLRGARFDEVDARRRIDAQLHTLNDAGVRHAVLSAFGCGAFLNPAEQVAELYRAALREHGGPLREVVFAVYAPGYGPDNYTPFARVFGAHAAA